MPLHAPRAPLTAALAATATLVLAAVLGGCGDRDGGRRSATTVPTTWQGFGPGAWPPVSWRPYADGSVFNRPIAAGTAPLPGSNRMVARVLSWGPPSDITAGLTGTDGDFDHPIFFAGSDDPVVTLEALRPWGDNPLTGRTIRVPPQARPAAGSDAHLAIVEPDGTEYDLWDVRDGGVRDGRLRFGWGGRLRIDGPGTDGAATAAGYGLLAGAIRPEELAAGRIDHALFLVQRCTGSGVGYDGQVRPPAPADLGSQFVPPAVKGGARCGGADREAPPMGARYQLDMSDEQIAALDLPAWKAAILRALARYGGFVGDTGATGLGFITVSGESYTAYGAGDPLVRLARSAGLPRRPDGTYRFDVAGGVDWARHLRVVPPPDAG